MTKYSTGLENNQFLSVRANAVCAKHNGDTLFADSYVQADIALVPLQGELYEPTDQVLIDFVLLKSSLSTSN